MTADELAAKMWGVWVRLDRTQAKRRWQLEQAEELYWADAADTVAKVLIDAGFPRPDDVEGAELPPAFDGGEE